MSDYSKSVLMGQKIAFLGLGAMGSRMAARLLEAGYDLSVFNRTPDRAAPLVERGASFEDSPHPWSELDRRPRLAN